MGLLYELLAGNGSIYVHIGMNMNSYARVVMDEVFGKEQHINEIIWKRRTGYMGTYNKFGVITDSLLLYSKGLDYVFNEQVAPNNPEYLNRFNQQDENGRWYTTDNLTRSIGSRQI